MCIIFTPYNLWYSVQIMASLIPTFIAAFNGLKSQEYAYYYNVTKLLLLSLVERERKSKGNQMIAVLIMSSSLLFFSLYVLISITVNYKMHLSQSLR